MELFVSDLSGMSSGTPASFEAPSPDFNPNVRFVLHLVTSPVGEDKTRRKTNLCHDARRGSSRPGGHSPQGRIRIAPENQILHGFLTCAAEYGIGRSWESPKSIPE